MKTNKARVACDVEIEIEHSDIFPGAGSLYRLTGSNCISVIVVKTEWSTQFHCEVRSMGRLLLVFVVGMKGVPAASGRSSWELGPTLGSGRSAMG